MKKFSVVSLVFIVILLVGTAVQAGLMSYFLTDEQKVEFRNVIWFYDEYLYDETGIEKKDVQFDRAMWIVAEKIEFSLNDLYIEKGKGISYRRDDKNKIDIHISEFITVEKWESHFPGRDCRWRTIEINRVSAKEGYPWSGKTEIYQFSPEVGHFKLVKVEPY